MAINRYRGGRYKIDDIKSRFSTVALDNEYQVFFSLNEIIGREATQLGINKNFLTEDLGLYVADAVLPGSSFGDFEVTGDRQGITERNAFDRIYDDVTFSFYVDRNYDVLRFFESWIQFINPLYSSSTGLAKNQITKFNYPDDYKCEMVITKFNRDLRGKSVEIGFTNGLGNNRDQLSYRFFRVWPYSLASTPVSYQGMNILRCNVTFRYDRYVVSEVTRIRKPLRGERVRNISDPVNILPPTPSTTSSSLPPEATTNSPPPLTDNEDSTSITTPPIDGNVGNTNGPGTEFAPTDSATGYRPTANDGPLLYPNGKPVYGPDGKIQSMF
ncbi:hypothetical protein S820908_008 [Synechococcus phage S-CAM9]|uniref:Uncharacterized protein n=1 Tax=Synechococcus phage S-CAM9 TaxID=1883369 RepID=A0A1D8KNZ9_9CAUD|nr:hypothetical protein BOW85_gp008 [Synechococcus phage S-CAM9]AOV60155.1 hypothetical protein S050808_008 [Synechococcus phage S-CAM9]AOV60383.1 hypothetical protein S820908_008 [Synechococcus phage S-CAM9]AOV60611.1 hypothetical protein N161109_008 [Synechococcus phage S-CAM9]